VAAPRSDETSWVGPSLRFVSSKDGAAFHCKLPLTRKSRNQLAGGEIIEGAEAAGELVVAQEVLAIERSQKLFGGAFPLLRVAIHAARHEVAVRVGGWPRFNSERRLWVPQVLLFEPGSWG